MHAHLASSHPLLAELLMGAVVAFYCVLNASSLDESEQLLAAGVVDALNAAHIEIKQAAACMRIDESQLRKQLRAEPSQHLSLTRLIRLPFSFWMVFGPALIQVVWRKRMQEMERVSSDVKRGA